MIQILNLHMSRRLFYILYRHASPNPGQWLSKPETIQPFALSYLWCLFDFPTFAVIWQMTAPEFTLLIVDILIYIISNIYIYIAIDIYF